MVEAPTAEAAVAGVKLRVHLCPVGVGVLVGGRVAVAVTALVGVRVLVLVGVEEPTVMGEESLQAEESVPTETRAVRFAEPLVIPVAAAV